MKLTEIPVFKLIQGVGVFNFINTGIKTPTTKTEDYLNLGLLIEGSLKTLTDMLEITNYQAEINKTKRLLELDQLLNTLDSIEQRLLSNYEGLDHPSELLDKENLKIKLYTERIQLLEERQQVLGLTEYPELDKIRELLNDSIDKKIEIIKENGYK